MQAIFCATLICPGWLHWIAGIVFQQVPSTRSMQIHALSGFPESEAKGEAMPGEEQRHSPFSWLSEHNAHPSAGSGRERRRNSDWFHMLNSDLISMPDKWEFPWYAGWDLAFHTLSLSLVDFDFAKEQLLLMLRNLYIHPNGQIPAYEWNFGDVNPPVHAWATLFLHRIESDLGRADLRFLERSFQGLMQNFSW